MPELQGRFAIRVELHELTVDDLHRILTEPQNALIKQQIKLMETEGVPAGVHRRRDPRNGGDGPTAPTTCLRTSVPVDCTPYVRR